MLLLLPAIAGAATCNTKDIKATTPDSDFIDNGDGTLVHKKTGLMWKRCVEGTYGDNCETGRPTTHDWKQAGLLADFAIFAGHKDWRLPYIYELIGIVEAQCYSPSINEKLFPNTPISYFWTASPAEDRAWSVNFHSGFTKDSRKTNAHYVRLVRDNK